MKKRIFLIVLDSFGIGGAPDAKEFGDEGSNTFLAVSKSEKLNIPNLKKLGLYNIDGIQPLPKEKSPEGAFARLVEVSKGKDTTIGHWEMSGVESAKPLPVFPNGFPAKIVSEFEAKTGRKVICNLPFSGTDVIREYGEEHGRTGALIVYTSADSVFQIAANEQIVPLEDLYDYCEIARNLLVDEYAVGRVIARPFIGDNKENFERTKNRHDYSLVPPSPTVLDALIENGKSVIGVGKIYDIFAGQGVSESIKTSGNADGMNKTIELTKRDFCGLAFINLVDFDMLYGHRNDVDGYAAALSSFDESLGELIPLLGKEDLLLITADHGCDPSTASTDHSRECVPFLAYGESVKSGTDLGVCSSFSHVANTIADYLGLPTKYPGESLLGKMAK